MATQVEPAYDTGECCSRDGACLYLGKFVDPIKN